jgi:hypothetical protein
MEAVVVALLLSALFAGSAGLARGTSAQSAGVLINEVELNPKGPDAGNEWIELYNPTSVDANIGDFKVMAISRSAPIIIPAGTVLGAGQLYALSVPVPSLENANMLTLVDGSGQVVDRTPSLVDRSDDSRTWQRIPDGGSHWRFMEATKGAPNDPATYRGKPVGGASEVDNSAQSTNTTGKCLGSALCLEGKVVRVSDANVVYVKKDNETYRVMLSLTKATGSRDARAYTQALCLGNNALVDQDDGQPGKGKAVVGVVYCSSQNLNQQLLDSHYVGIDAKQCAASEFAGQDWAKRNGC